MLEKVLTEPFDNEKKIHKFIIPKVFGLDQILLKYSQKDSLIYMLYFSKKNPAFCRGISFSLLLFFNTWLFFSRDNLTITFFDLLWSFRYWHKSVGADWIWSTIFSKFLKTVGYRLRHAILFSRVVQYSCLGDISRSISLRLRLSKCNIRLSNV